MSRRSVVSRPSRPLTRALAAVGASLGLVLAPVAAWACEDHDANETAAAATSAETVRAGQIVRDAPEGEYDGVEFVGNLPEVAGATAINFLDYGHHRRAMFVTGTFGLKSYDVTNPENPRLLDSVDMPGFWENEDMDVDPKRKLVFMSQDPRAFDQPQDSGESGVYIVSARKPADLKILSFTKVPAGHTSSCINDCKYLWTGGPMKDADQPDDWEGRPVFVTDIRNPRKPSVYPDPVDLGRNDGVTDYAHDVQVDKSGVAWVSGRGGLRGYWTKGRHWDPVEKRFHVASAAKPIPYAGGKFVQQPDVGFPGGSFAHNALRPMRSLGGHEPGDLALVTIENFSDSCETDGRLLFVSIGDSKDGQGWHSTPDDPYRLPIVGEFTPWGKPGTDPNQGCSAHYFQLRDDLVVQSFYGNGTRFVDVSDPTNPTQVGYYRPEGGSSAAPYWNKDVIYVADGRRGVDIIRPALDD
ncbi:hypothetical protein MU582_01895 [Nocardioidaceae bacterium SCSIO 66511]|nr:hypothetical protein MU582_01895 [Nocardioidaceae bacterium SCSIO 66511]